MIRKIVSRITGWTAKLPIPKALRILTYGWYVRRYGVNLAESAYPLEDFANFQQFFTRPLTKTCRPIDKEEKALVSPVDGRVYAIGHIEQTTLFQAKGIDYPLDLLLAKSPRQSDFNNGHFVTLYLSPGDCHRIYAPLDLHVEETLRLGGNLFSVKPASVKKIPNLFCRNERFIMFVRSRFGPAAIILVGALNVGSMIMTCKKKEQIHKGEEIAQFRLGSTVILLFPQNTLRWSNLTADDYVRIGKKIGTLN